MVQANPSGIYRKKYKLETVVTKFQRRGKLPALIAPRAFEAAARYEGSRMAAQKSAVCVLTVHV